MHKRNWKPKQMATILLISLDSSLHINIFLDSSELATEFLIIYKNINVKDF